VAAGQGPRRTRPLRGRDAGAGDAQAVRPTPDLAVPQAVLISTVNQGALHVRSGEALREHMASIWERDVMACTRCWDADDQPILKPEFSVAARSLRWRNRYRVPHLGTDFGMQSPRVVFVGLEDPEDVKGAGPLNPLAEIGAIGKYLTTSLGGGDRHRWGEVHLAHDLLGVPDDSMGISIFSRLASINSHLCSLVSGDGRQSASHCLRHTCSQAWKIILTELEPDILVLEGKRFVWDEALANLKELHWPTEALPCASPPGRMQLRRIHAPSHDFILLSLYHPSRWWSARKHPYYRDVLGPVLETLQLLGAIPHFGQ